MTLTLEEAAVRHGAFAWIERRLFELTGAWAAAPALPDGARATLFTSSAAHAWHAELWIARLPVLAGVDRDALVHPVGAVAPELLAELEVGCSGASRTGPDGIRLLTGLARVVLPALLESYDAFGKHLGEVADGPSIRALALVHRDTIAERDQLCALLESLVEADERRDGEGGLARAPIGARGDDDAALFPWSDADANPLFGAGGPST